MLPLLWKTIAKLRAKTPTSPQGGDQVLLVLGTGSLETSLLRCIVDFRESGISQLLPKSVPNRVTSYKSEKSISGRQTRAGLSNTPCVSCDFVSDVAEGRTLACAGAVVVVLMLIFRARRRQIRVKPREKNFRHKVEVNVLDARTES